MKKEENTEDEFLKDLYPNLFEKRIVVNTEPPEGYFENLPDVVMDKIQALPEKSNKNSAKVIRFINVRNMAIAAAAAVFLALVPFFKSELKTDTDSVRLSEQTAYAESDFIDLDIDDTDIYDALAAEGIYSILNVDNLTDEEIIEYLVNDGSNEDFIFENI